MLHDEPAASVLVQVRDWIANWFALAPPMLIELIVSDAVPVFVSVKVNGALVVRRACVPKPWDVGVSETAACTPVPASETRCGLVASESVIVSVPVRTPVALGRKLTLIRQLRPAPRLPPGQLFVWTKSPLATMLLIVSALVPTFASVIACEALVVPTIWLPNSSDNVLRLTLLTVWVATGDVLVRK